MPTPDQSNALGRAKELAGKLTPIQKITLGAVLLTVIVGLTRVYLAAHWASDVLAGWSVGAAWAMILWLAAYVMQHRRAASAPGPHDLPLPGSPVAAKDAPVIGE